MNFSFHLPLAAEDISPDEPPLQYGSDIDEDYINSIHEHLKKSADRGAGMLIVPTDLVSENRGEENLRDDEYFDAVTALTRAAADMSLDLPVCAALKAGITPESYDCGAFEEAHMRFLEQMALLKDSGADLVLLRGSEHLWQMRAAVMAANVAGIPIIVTITVDEEGMTSLGADSTAALLTLQSLGAAAFGIACKDGNEELCSQLEHLLPHAEIPLAAVGVFKSEDITGLTSSGASIFISSGAAVDSSIFTEILSSNSAFESGAEKDSFAAAVESEAFFLPDDLVFSAPLECGYDLAEDLIDLDDENINTILVRLNSSDDVSLLASQGGFSRLPVTVNSNDINTLEAALRYFPGRLIIDTHCDIPRKTIRSLAGKYGAITY